MNKVGLIVPTLNAGDTWSNWLQALAQQTRQPDRLLLIDSSSTDHTVALARKQGFEIRIIDKSTFNHGGTRQWGLEVLHDMDVIVFLTQDAVLADRHAIENLLAAFDDPVVATAYGRQLPHPNAGPVAAHARLFNYPHQNQLRSLVDRDRFGIKTVFTSNSFAAYRRDVLLQLGGFPTHTVMNEDTFVAGLILKAGWSIAYRADAKVYHSHDYGFIDEFKRYFDIGVFHANTLWLQQTFGGAVGEGRRFVLSELMYLLKFAPGLIPSAIIRTGLKALGYKLGMWHERLPFALKPYLSMHKAYWQMQPDQRVYEDRSSKCKMG
jgi:rhamnosyltransferase